MTVLVVTGTGTGVGKTVVTAAVAALAPRCCTVVKPAQTGVSDDESGDLADVVRLAGDDVGTLELARYPDPLSPEAAARRSGRPALTVADVADAVAGLDRGQVLVEGAGGLLVRFGPDGGTLADVARRLGAPVLVVTAAGLGTLNATALTLEALAAREVPVQGLVIGSWPAEPDLAARCNVDDLRAMAPLLGALPEGAGRLDRTAFRAVAESALAPALGGSFDAERFAAEVRR